MVNFILLAGGLVLAGFGIMVIKGQKKEDEELYKIQRQPPLQLEDAVADVPAKIAGKVVPIKLLKSNYQKVDCVYYVSMEEELQKSGKSHKWVTVFYDYGFEPFNVDDGTGKVRMDLLGEEKRRLYDELRGLYRGGTINPMEAVGRVLEAASKFPIIGAVPKESDLADFERVLEWEGMKGGMEVFGGLKLGSVRARRYEWVLRPDSKIFAYGMIRKKAGGLIMQPDSALKLIASTKSEEEYLKGKRSDDKLQILLGYGLGILGTAMFLVNFLID
ncbi:MAG: GIDE domain-containing protein [Candidatus Micrarchaeota archaeon]